jgi:hypothetical protein
MNQVWDDQTRRICTRAIRKVIESDIRGSVERDQGPSPGQTRVERLEQLRLATRTRMLNQHRLARHPLSDTEADLYLEAIDGIFNELKQEAAA